MKIIAVLPAPDWVVEIVNDDGTKSVFPCAGFGVDEQGEIHTLPLSLGKDSVTRPATEADITAVRRTGARLSQRPTTAQFGSMFFADGKWIEDAT